MKMNRTDCKQNVTRCRMRALIKCIYSEENTTIIYNPFQTLCPNDKESTLGNSFRRPSAPGFIAQIINMQRQSTLFSSTRSDYVTSLLFGRRYCLFHYPVASNAVVNGKTLHFLMILSSHFLNARRMPSGISSASFPIPELFLMQITTEAIGTKGRSSAEAARIPYSWAKTKAARKAANFEDLCWGAGEKERVVKMLWATYQ